ncbi:FAD-dependent oxidoreductase [Streptomyces sp. S.PNR 29]|uniref:NAD(P)/FAD-dependent oxidoreductase n=1 Tax=Streptomyces sp. S.PNR 29 TaxID=2973805 RepID=UPI0025B0613E|nr:FAD-dependent oxidoreductase [Streptomyces sp. S.PNR 29]MDN0200138.1 FAD-binding oxidoreductase [Streptomyces sp. S.PNR 29]
MSVVVVGAGIVGSSVAYHLARRGVSVTLLDRGPGPATGVTGGSFAWIGDRGGDWPGGARDLRGSVRADYRRLESEVPGVAVRRCGSLDLAADAEPGEGRFRVGRDEIRALEPELRSPPEWAVHTPSDAGVDAVAVTAALVRAARALGARVVFGADVTSLEAEGGRVRGVASSVGFHAGSTVVLAAGTEVVRLAEPLGIRLPVRTSPACLIRLAAPPGLVRTIVAAPDFEVREVSDGQLLMTVSLTGDTTSPLRLLRASFRRADSCRVLERRVGGRPVPADGPLIGPVTPDGSVYAAVTHSAVTLAPTVGRLVASELATGAPAAELRRCRPRGLSPGSGGR